MPFIPLETIVEVEVVPGCRAKMIHGELLTIVYYDIDQGAVFPLHSHPHEQISTVVEGEFELELGGEKCLMTVGIPALTPSNTIHGGVARTKCRLIDAFSPVREDYRKLCASLASK